MNIDHFISEAVSRSVEALYGPLGEEQLQIQKTRKEFDGDYTLVVFPLLRRSRKSPEATAAEIGEHLTAHMPEVKSFNVIKGFLNLALSDGFWADRFAEIAADGAFGQAPATGRNVMIEYSSPNTNKPLHLGHIRNNLLGYSVAQILKANGHTVIKANLENNISSLKAVDKTEAATKLLLASQNLEASYAVLQQAMSLSLLDYIK